MKYAACLALAVTLCAAGLSRAADNALPGNYEHLKNLEPLIGTWTGERDIPQDSPTANIKKGKYTLTVTWKWDAKKSAILSHHSIGRPGTVFGPGPAAPRAVVSSCRVRQVREDAPQRLVLKLRRPGSEGPFA